MRAGSPFIGFFVLYCYFDQIIQVSHLFDVKVYLILLLIDETLLNIGNVPKYICRNIS